MNSNSDKIIYELNKVYPAGLSFNQLAKITTQALPIIKDFMNELNDHQWPIEITQSNATLKLPLFSVKNIQDLLPEDMKKQLTFKSFKTIDSTNAYATTYLSKLVDCSVFFAYHQTRGKGRMDRSWHSPVGASISMSLILKERGLEDRKLNIISLITALALVKALDQMKITSQIKWPNDVLVNGRKVAGILCQMEAHSSKKVDLIIGLGININQVNFPDDLKDKATSLRNEYNQVIDPNTLIANFLIHFHKIMKLEQSNRTIISQIKDYSYLPNDIVQLTPANGPIEMVQIIDLAEDGGLIVKNQETQQTKTVYSGEVSIRKFDGSYI